MTIGKIRKLQADYGYDRVQKRIEDGSIWKFEGSAGRGAMAMLEAGVCFLPTMPTSDYYGNGIPSRNYLEAGSKGTLELSSKFWSQVQSGEIKLEQSDSEWL